MVITTKYKISPRVNVNLWKEQHCFLFSLFHENVKIIWSDNEISMKYHYFWKKHIENSWRYGGLLSYWYIEQSTMFSW